MTDFLFTTPSMLSGVARVVDLGGLFDAYNASPSPEIADRRAAAADWQTVRGDLLRAAQLVAGKECEQEAPAAR